MTALICPLVGIVLGFALGMLVTIMLIGPAASESEEQL